MYIVLNIETLLGIKLAFVKGWAKILKYYAPFPISKRIVC
jgi:hypothetical protein